MVVVDFHLRVSLLFSVIRLNCSRADYCCCMPNKNVGHFPRAITEKVENGTIPSFSKNERNGIRHSHGLELATMIFALSLFAHRMHLVFYRISCHPPRPVPRARGELTTTHFHFQF